MIDNREQQIIDFVKETGECSSQRFLTATGVCNLNRASSGKMIIVKKIEPNLYNVSNYKGDGEVYYW